jgi:polysaccharide export outer membrane protein
LRSAIATRPASGPFWIIGALCASIVALTGSALGQDRTAAYRIGPGDVIEVHVWREPDLSGSYRIGPDGFLHHVLAGAVPASGSDIEELTGRLRETLERDYLREARVSISLVESARRRASVVGAIARPGGYPLREDMRVLELVFAAGGVSEFAGSRAKLLRDASPGGAAVPAPGGGQAPRQEIPIDLAALLSGSDLSGNLILAPGDVLVISAEQPVASAAPPKGRVRVVGEVERPGSYPLSDAPTVLDALLAAGGLSEYAAGNRARLVRGAGTARVETRIRLGHVLEGREDSENIELRDGDMIVVPESFF